MISCMLFAMKEISLCDNKLWGCFLSQLVGGVKRPSPEPLMDNGIGGNGKAVKKPKVPKKKKKRDPNEPQK